LPVWRESTGRKQRTTTRRLEQLAPKALERVGAGQLSLAAKFEQSIAAPMLPTVCASSRWRDRVASMEALSQGVQAFGVGHQVKAAIDSLSDDERAEVARWLLALASSAADAAASNAAQDAPNRGLIAVLARLQSHDGSPLLVLVLEALHESELENMFANRGVQNVEQLWDALPDGAARTRLEHAWVKHLSKAPVSEVVADAFLLRTSCSDEHIEPVARHAGHEGAVALWRRRPRLARQLLRLEFSEPRGGFWIQRAPEAQLPELLDEVEERARPGAPGWVWNWLRWLGQAHPKFAERAYVILQRSAQAGVWGG
jgi:hypothetical protein